LNWDERSSCPWFENFSLARIQQEAVSSIISAETTIGKEFLIPCLILLSLLNMKTNLVIDYRWNCDADAEIEDLIDLYRYEKQPFQQQNINTIEESTYRSDNTSSSTCRQFFNGDVLESIEAAKHIQWVEAFVNRARRSLKRKRLLCCILLRKSLRGIALLWFERYTQSIWMDWLQLKGAFLEEFGILSEVNGNKDIDQFISEVRSLRQEDHSIAQYIEEAERIEDFATGYILQTWMAQMFIRGIKDPSERQQILWMLPNDRPYTLDQAI
jgi:hypothetical protein